MFKSLFFIRMKKGDILSIKSGDISHATTLELGQWMQETIPNCKWVRFSAAEYGNHDLAQNAYKRFNREVLAFLKDH